MTHPRDRIVRKKRELRKRRELQAADDGRTRARRIHDSLQRKRVEQRQQVKQEAQFQGGNPEMHDNPDRENRLLFEACDDIIREPDAIDGAREIEERTRLEERRVHDDGDLEAVDDIRDLEEQDFNPF